MNYILEILILIATLVVASIHAQRYDYNLSISNTWHWLWLLPFIIVITCSWFVTHNWKLINSLILIRGLFFNPALNFMRKNIISAGCINRFFYLHGESEYGSVWDKLLEKTGKAYTFLWAVGFLFLIYLQFNL